MKDLPRVGVHPVLGFPDGSLGYQAYVTALGDESSDYPIMILVRPCKCQGLLSNAVTTFLSAAVDSFI